MAQLIFFSIVSVLIATVCSSSLPSIDGKIYNVQDTYNGSADNCKLIPPSNPKLVDRVNGGVTVQFEWNPKGDECQKEVFWYTVRWHNSARLLGQGSSLTSNIRGLVFRNLTAGTIYRLETFTTNGKEKTSKLEVTFNSSMILEVRNSEINEPYSETHVSIIQKGVENMKADDECKQISPPTNGKAFQITKNSATVSFEWKENGRGECKALWYSSRLYEKIGNGKKLMTRSSMSALYYVKGQHYSNLKSDTEYFTETRIDGENCSRSTILVTSFRTKM